MVIVSRTFVFEEHTWLYMTEQVDSPTNPKNKNTGFAIYPAIDYVNHTNFFEWKGYSKPDGTVYFRYPKPVIIL